MKRRRNLNFGFLPARPTRAELLKSRREFKAGVRHKVKALRSEYARLRKSAHSGRTASTRKLEQLFHEVYGPEGMLQNPRVLPGMTGKQLEAIRKLIRGSAMAQKRKSKKKKSSRKGKMPAGLRAYWAKKRAAKAKRNPKRRKRNRVRVRTRTIVKYRMRKVKVYPKRKRTRRSNPLRRARRIRLNGFTAGQIKRVAAAIRQATGKRVRVVKP